MPFVYVHPHVSVSVREYSPHNPHHKGHTENDKRRVVGDDLCLGFASFKILVNFAANEYWQDSCLHLYSEILELFLNIICRFLIFKRYDNTNNGSWFFSVCGGCLSRILDCKKVLMVEFTKRSRYLRCAKTFFRQSHSSEK